MEHLTVLKIDRKNFFESITFFYIYQEQEYVKSESTESFFEKLFQQLVNGVENSTATKVPTFSLHKILQSLILQTLIMQYLTLQSLLGEP